MHSPGKAGSFGAVGTHLGGGMFGNPPNNLAMKSESPTMMVDQHTPEDVSDPASPLSLSLSLTLSLSLSVSPSLSPSLSLRLSRTSLPFLKPLSCEKKG